MDIYTLIHNDHEEAKKFLEQLANAANQNSRMALFAQLKETVTTHNDAEADSFYIALEAHAPTRGAASRSRKEHEDVDAMFIALSDSSLSGGEWESKFSELHQALIMHISEEEGEVFVAARKVLSPKIASELAVAMQQLKQVRQHLLRRAS